MINLQLFHILLKLPHIAGKIQQLAPAMPPLYGFLGKGFAYEFYRTNKNKQLVSWFWGEGEFVIPTSSYSNIVLSWDAEFLEFEYSAMYPRLKGSEENRDEYALARAWHNLEIAERISDIQYLGPFKQYMKLQQRIPQVFEYAGKETIASFLDIDVMELKRFMLKRPVSLPGRIKR